jgi:hypothetical protein
VNELAFDSFSACAAWPGGQALLAAYLLLRTTSTRSFTARTSPRRSRRGPPSKVRYYQRRWQLECGHTAPPRRVLLTSTLWTDPSPRGYYHRCAPTLSFATSIICWLVDEGRVAERFCHLLSCCRRPSESWASSAAATPPRSQSHKQLKGNPRQP